MDLLGTIPARHRGLGLNSLSDHSPELVVALRSLRPRIHFVNSAVSASGNGASWDGAVLTIDEAINLSAPGDIILVADGHAETISAAAGIDIDVAGLTIIGLGNGGRRPRITLDTVTTTDIDVDAANVTLENLVFVAGFADVAVCLDVNADDFTVRNCEFQESAALNFLVCVQDAAAGGSDRITIEGCRANCPDAANTHFVNFAGTGDGHLVRNNILFGDWGTMAIGGAGVVTNCVVVDNVISNAAAVNDSCINFAATATGICMRNLACGAAAQANGVTATAMAIAENYYGVVSEDLSAILDPIVT